MNLKTILLLCLSLFHFSSSFAFQIQDIHGKPEVQIFDDQGKVRKLEKLTLKTKLGGEVMIKTNSTDSLDLSHGDLQLRILPSTEIHFPQVEGDGGKLSVLEIRRGSLRWISSREVETLVNSAFFSLAPSKGSFVIRFLPEIPSAEALIFEGELNFSELNGEKTVVLKEGQKMIFLGQKENGEILFDKLLKNKSIPKGHKSEIFNISQEENEKYSPVIERQKKQAAIESAKKKNQVQKNKRKGEICQSPAGLFNECAWRCENDQGKMTPCNPKNASLKCYRYRCNAGGEWKEATLVEKSQAARVCVSGAPVGPCDY